MNSTPKRLAWSVTRSILRGATIALYLTAAFAIVPALGVAPDSVSPDGSRPVLEGVLVALGLMVVTIGTALARWFREEQPST